MSATNTKFWIVTYDIAAPRRLQRVHRFMAQVGIPVQYSVFGVVATAARMQAHLAGLTRLIDPRSDDIRTYHLPRHCRVWLMGRQGFPDGIDLFAGDAMRLLVARPEDEPASDELFPLEVAAPDGHGASYLL